LILIYSVKLCVLCGENILTVTKIPPTDVATLLASSDSDSELVLLGQILGPETLKVVLDTLAGQRGCETYIPSFENFIMALTRPHRDAEICRRYDGTNTSQLAIEYNLKPRRIQQIVSAQKTTRENA